MNNKHNSNAINLIDHNQLALTLNVDFQIRSS